jgi:hypothetical protein
MRNLVVENVNLGQVYRSQFESAARRYDGDLDAGDRQLETEGRPEQRFRGAGRLANRYFCPLAAPWAAPVFQPAGGRGVNSGFAKTVETMVRDALAGR